MSIFRKRPDAASLQRARDALAREQAAVVQLTAGRAQKLIETEDLSAVAQVDRQIEQHRLNAAALRDKLPLIEADLHLQAQEQRERTRADAIVQVAAVLRQREAAAEQLEAACRRVVELYGNVVNKDLANRWPFPSAPTVGWSNSETIAGEVIGQLYLESRAAGAGLFPHARAFLSELNRIMGIDGICKRVRGHSEQLLASLRAANIEPAPAADEEIAA